MHDFVVRQRQHEVFGPRVHLTESQLVVLEFAIHRVFFKIREAVVHPAHIPFHRKPQTAQIDWPGNCGPGGGFFSKRQHAGMQTVYLRVELTQEGNRLEVFATAMLIG